MENDEKKEMPESEAIAALKKQLKEKDEIIKDKDKTIMQLINDAGKDEAKKDDSDSKDDESKEKTPEDEEKENREKRFKYYEKMLKR